LITPSEDWINVALAPSLVVGGQSVPILGVALLGIGVGYVAGMFGIGGGFLMTPLLVVLFGVPLPVAVGSGLCQMIGTALVANLRHGKLGQGERRIDMLMLPGCLVGVELGARALTRLGRAGLFYIAGHSVPCVTLVVEGAYTTLLLFVAWNYWRHGRSDSGVLDELRPGPLARTNVGPVVNLPAAGLHGTSALLIANIGLGLGFLSGLLGIGGGVALNPVLIYGYGLPIRQSVGTGILVLFATAVVGTVVHSSRGHVHLGLATVLLIGGTASAQFGALATRRLSGATLGRIHALVLVLAASAVVWDLGSKFD
jgi:uncharacterized membrane protein YfcA